MQHHTSYNAHHAASGIDHTTHASTAWHFDTTCIYDARRRQQLGIVADRSKTNFRAASSSSTQSPHPLPSSSLHYTAACHKTMHPVSGRLPKAGRPNWASEPALAIAIDNQRLNFNNNLLYISVLFKMTIKTVF